MSDIGWMAVNFIGGLLLGAGIWRWGYREGVRNGFRAGYEMRRED